jgi:hypothetical protein
MNKIKEQIDALVVFSATDFDSLQEEETSIKDRCIEGIEKMKEAKVFTDKEIAEINQYWPSVVNARYNAAKQDIANTIRTNFIF